MLPYSRQAIDEQDIQSVVDVLQSDWLTTGPLVSQFESAIADYSGSRHAVSMSNGTAALHAAANALGLQTGDEVIVPAITFVATANAVIYCGATPVFADVDPETLLIDPQDVIRKITPRTRAVFPVDYAGQTCDYPTLRNIAMRNGLKIVADCAHSLGGMSFGRPITSWTDMVCHSFHPVKQITTCEGGMVATNSSEMAADLQQFRNHGISTDHHQRAANGQFAYDMQSLGFNYRLSDVHCALGLSQLQKLGDWTQRRARIAAEYHRNLQDMDFVRPLEIRRGASHGWHLFVVRWDSQMTGLSRDDALAALRGRGIGANVHYRPVYQHSFYRQLGEHLRFDCCPHAETVYDQILSLPIFPAMTANDVTFVVNALREIGASHQVRAKVV
ncbi:MAG: UDP-4-amino-4,6-dideoxy-N-acetyl-beta-L-altrosamine transaminase [Pirellulaceae bacterium]